MNINQGSIFMADLDPIKGHEQGGYRPVLVMQADILCKNLNTVIVAPITSNLGSKGKLTTYFLSKKTSRLNMDSVVLLYQLRTLDKGRLKNKISTLKHEEFLMLKEYLKFVF